MERAARRAAYVPLWFSLLVIGLFVFVLVVFTR